MQSKLRVLLITRECLRTDSNEGNVLINLFENQPMELANIYCKPGVPDVDMCYGRYFQLTDKMALCNVLRRETMGENVTAEESPTVSSSAQKENKKFYDFFRGHNWEIFYLGRELLWSLADFRSMKLDGFIEQFNPDVIFAPLCYSRYVLRIHQYVIGKAKCPAVTYIYDDIYSLKQLRFSPVYWLNRFLLRAEIRKSLHHYRFAYTMTEQQAAEYGRMLGIPMKVLRKAAPSETIAKVPHEGIRLIYAGGTYYGRDKTLTYVADAVRKLNQQGEKVQLDIYTGSPMKARFRSKLDDGKFCHVYGIIPFDELQKQYAASDIALHVESFRKKNALLTRLSFSTKIVDCLASGCAVVAVCPKINAGWQYLRDEKAAICIDDVKQVYEVLSDLICNDKIEASARRARACLKAKHEYHIITNGLCENLLEIAKE
jgi:hypothetical protein